MTFSHDGVAVDRHVLMLSLHKSYIVFSNVIIISKKNSNHDWFL